jgi:hypothetical protein
MKNSAEKICVPGDAEHQAVKQHQLDPKRPPQPGQRALARITVLEYICPAIAEQPQENGSDWRQYKVKQ